MSKSEKDILLNKKVNLLSFQEYLNRRFNENSISDDIEFKKQKEELGLAEEIANLIFLFPLKDLRKISSDNKMEEISIVKNWILGFNQLQGEIYTIINLEKIIELLIGVEHLNKEHLLKLNKNDSYLNIENMDINLLYLKNIRESRFAIILKSLELGNTNKFKSVSDEDIESIKKIVNKEELTVLNQYLELKDKDDNKDIDLIEGYKYSIVDLIDTIYFNESLNRPVFVINIEKLIKLLVSLSPF